ncbi:MAG: SLBB domain-containing protein [Pseudomonadota bacterium]
MRSLNKGIITFIILIFYIGSVFSQSYYSTNKGSQSTNEHQANANPSTYRPKALGSQPFSMQDSTKSDSVFDNATGLEYTPLEKPIDPDKYKVGVGDRLELHLWGKTNIKGLLIVGPDGKIRLPKGGYVIACGETPESHKTLSQINLEVKKILSKYYIDVNFELSLNMPRTFLVKVVGAIVDPGIYQALPVERASEVIFRAGGLSPNGSMKYIELRRNGHSEIIDLEAFNFGAKTAYNPYIQEGDIIYVPIMANVVSLYGEINRPGNFEFEGEMRLSTIVERAGGTSTRLSHLKPIKISRLWSDRKERQIIEIDTALFLSGDPKYDSFVKANDRIIFPSSEAIQRMVAVNGAILGGISFEEKASGNYEGKPGEEREGLYPLDDGETVTDIIKKAGGITPYADLENAFIVRREIQGDNIEVKTIKVDLHKIYIEKDYTYDPLLEPGDILTIPSKRSHIYVTGEVKSPKPIPYRQQLTAMEYIGAAGGLTNRAKFGAAVVIKVDGTEIDLDDNPVLEPGDVIFIPEQLFKFWQDWIAITTSLTSLALSILAITNSISSN